MAITLTAIVSSPNKKVYQLKCAEADTTATIAHGFPSAPTVYIIPSNSTIALAAAYGITADGTNFTPTKQNAVGSAGATPGTSVAAIVVAELNPQG